MRTSLRIIVLLAVLASLSALTMQARHRKTAAKSSSFSYYMLVLSYAPDYCAQKGADQDPRECGAGKDIGFVVHGLWPQGETTRGPQNCGAAGTLPPSLITQMLNYIPTETLINHEWATHGTCSGLSADDYFALVRKARDSVKIPAALLSTQQQSLTPASVQSLVAGANPGFPATAFRTSCYADKELEEVRVCMTKNLSARACGSSAGQCSAKSVVLLPVH